MLSDMLDYALVLVLGFRSPHVRSVAAALRYARTQRTWSVISAYQIELVGRSSWVWVYVGHTGFCSWTCFFNHNWSKSSSKLLVRRIYLIFVYFDSSPYYHTSSSLRLRIRYSFPTDRSRSLSFHMPSALTGTDLLMFNLEITPIKQLKLPLRLRRSVTPAASLMNPGTPREALNMSTETPSASGDGLWFRRIIFRPSQSTYTTNLVPRRVGIFKILLQETQLRDTRSGE